MKPIKRLTPWWKRIAFQCEASIRFDEPLFLWDCTWNEKLLYKHQLALWWPRFNVTMFGIRLGVALWIGKPHNEAH